MKAEELLKQFGDIKEAIHLATIEKDNIAKDYFAAINLHEGDVVDVAPFKHLEIKTMNLVNEQGLIRLVCRHVTTIIHLDTYIKDIKHKNV